MEATPVKAVLTLNPALQVAHMNPVRYGHCHTMRSTPPRLGCGLAIAPAILQPLAHQHHKSGPTRQVRNNDCFLMNGRLKTKLSQMHGAGRLQALMWSDWRNGSWGKHRDTPYPSEAYVPTDGRE